MGYDRGEVLARIPLASLCDELLGPHHGRGRTASWPCADPGHGPQTGKTPPVTVFQPRSGIERWHCHACGAGGTAIDLVMVTQRVGFREALELLARRVGAADETWRPATPRPQAVGPEPARPALPTRLAPALESYVSACEAWLWAPAGAPMRRWLEGRGLGEEVLRVNRIGADPGPRALRREHGLPRGGPAVVFPLLDPERRVLYLQARYLRPNRRKYDNPSAELVPTSPRLAEMRLPGTARNENLVLMCEGVPDAALTVAQYGYRAVAVLGAGLPDERLADALVARYPQEHLLVAFDADHRGKAGSERLRELFAQAGAGDRVGVLAVPETFGDLNAWAQAARESFSEELETAICRAAPRPPLAEQTMTMNQEERPVAPTHRPKDSLDGRPDPALADSGVPALGDLLEHWPTSISSSMTDRRRPRTSRRSWGPSKRGALGPRPWRSTPLGASPTRSSRSPTTTSNHSDAHRALDSMAEAVDRWADVGLHDGRRDVSGSTCAPPDDLALPASLLPDMPDPTLEGPGLGW